MKQVNHRDRNFRKLCVQLPIVVSKLVASCNLNCGLDKLSAMLEMKTLRRQLTVHVAA